ncbi:MAG: hypothetical protein M3425_03310 [Actinomycetota bacterium]|nr:hypothetical protein [Actinomycetota bacterium]
MADQQPTLRIGSWAKSGQLIGLVAAMDDDTVTLFDPGQRQQAQVPRSLAEAVPAGAVTVTVRVQLPVPHGVDEGVLRRWVATLTDEVVRERAYAALAEAGLDEGAALPVTSVDVEPVASGTVCLCGARTPAPPGTQLQCVSCGRTAVAAPTAVT